MDYSLRTYKPDYNKITLYSLSENSQLYNSDIDNLISDINNLDEFNNLKISEIFELALNLLNEDNETEKKENLKSVLGDLLSKIFNLQNIYPHIIKKAVEVKSLLQPKPSLAHTSLKPTNIFKCLAKQEFAIQDSSEIFKDYGCVHNVKNDTYAITIIDEKHKEIEKTDIDNKFALIVVNGSDNPNEISREKNTLKLWNLETGEVSWEFDPNMFGIFYTKIHDNHVVCAGFTDQPFSQKQIETIQIIDRQKNKKPISIKDSRLTNKICIIDDKIFCSLKDGTIGEWDLKGRLIRFIPSGIPSNEFPLFAGSGNYLVQASHSTIIIHDLKTNNKNKVILTEPQAAHISAIHLNGGRLICGFSSPGKEGNHVNCCIIDLQSGQINNQYAFANEHTVQTIAADENWVYLGHSTGTLVAVNLAEKNHTVLNKQHHNCIDYLFVQNRFLVSGSEQMNANDAEIKIWDIQSQMSLAELEPPNLKDLFWDSRKISALSGNTLIHCDFMGSCEGRKEISLKTKV